MEHDAVGGGPGLVADLGGGEGGTQGGAFGDAAAGAAAAWGCGGDAGARRAEAGGDAACGKREGGREKKGCSVGHVAGVALVFFFDAGGPLLQVRRFFTRSPHMRGEWRSR